MPCASLPHERKVWVARRKFQHLRPIRDFIKGLCRDTVGVMRRLVPKAHGLNGRSDPSPEILGTWKFLTSF